MITEKSVTFSLVMPCGPKSEQSIKKAIESILDQDYDSWELICVVNGDWKGRKKTENIILHYCKKDVRIRIKEMDEGNVCDARNYGAEYSWGEYISFFSSDFYMFPGALKKWKETFDEHKEADFVYSGYRLMKNGDMQEMFVPSRPFDSWELEIEPYIDGGFPVKRKVWEKCKWDPKIKSLNDWDWWISISRAGFKGYFMLDMTYAAEMPKAGGLSVDSSRNWLERVGAIKKKWNIPDRDICVVSLGAAPHGKKLAKILDADFRVAPQNKPHNYKMLYLIGFYIGDGTSAMAHANVFKNARNAIHIIHWIGSDVLQLMSVGWKVPYNELKVLIDSLNNRVNLSEFILSQNELETMGIKTKIIPLPVEDKFGFMPLPNKKFTVAIYAPRTRTADYIYNMKLMKDIAKSCPQWDFVFFGGGTDLKAKNVTNEGWVPMKELVAKCHCLLRIAYHDGMPITPIEFRMAGRDTITSVEMPYMWHGGSGIIHDDNYVQKKEGLIKLLKEISKKQGTGSWNREAKKAREYYLKLNDVDKYKESIYKVLNERDTEHSKIRTSSTKRKKS